MSGFTMQFEQSLCNSLFQEKITIQQDFAQDNLAEINIQDLIPLGLDMTFCYKEASHIHLDHPTENQADEFVSNQLGIFNQPCNFTASNYLYKTYDCCQQNIFSSRTELDEITNFDFPSFSQNPVGPEQSFEDFQFLCSSNIKTTESNWSCHQTQSCDNIGRTNAEKCKKYRDRK